MSGRKDAAGSLGGLRALRSSLSGAKGRRHRKGLVVGNEGGRSLLVRKVIGGLLIMPCMVTDRPCPRVPRKSSMQSSSKL